jgi:glycosyltransferase involved in cell wall biosynthesis
MSKVDLSIITPCYNEVESIQDCINAINGLMKSKLPNLTYEHIIIDNNSTDETVQIVKVYCAKDRNVKLLVNSRNVGASKNIYLGLKESSGNVVIPMYAADLQDPVDVIYDFYTEWRKGFLVVFGVREDRKEIFLLKNLRTLYYKIIQKLANSYIPVNAGEFMLVDRRVLEPILETNDYRPYIRGMIANSGVKSSEIKYFMNAREKGKSKANLVTLIDVALNGFIGTSRISARLILLCGFMFSSLGILIGIINAITNFTTQIKSDILLSPEGTLILIVGGIQMFFIGIIGEYVLSIHGNVRRDPEPFFVEKLNF